MNKRGARLLATAEPQIVALEALLEGRSDADLRRPGRERLGDGTAGALALHVAVSYRRIAALAAGQGGPGDHGAPRATTVRDVLDRLADARTALHLLADLDDGQLDAVPPAGAVRFADGQRTLERVITGALRHQRHQIDALEAVLQ